MTTTAIGNQGEFLACQFLEKQGYKILERNFRIRGGEIDIIAQDKNILVFVEVKTRNSDDYGPPLESITPWKIRFLIKTAQFYLLKMKWDNKQYRFDAIGIDFTADSDNPKIEHILNITS